MAAKRPLKRRRARSPWVRRIKRTFVGLGMIFGTALIAGLVVYIPIYQEAVDDAQNIDQKLVVRDETPTVIVSGDKSHWVLDSVANVRRETVKLRDLPDHIRYAIVAAEDRRFYDHHGVDPIGLGRAVYYRGAAGGGSTIPMQIAKLMINGDARTPLRKLKDIATAQQIENLKSKDEILDLYANYAYYGEHAYGIQRAAEIYFGKDAKDLTVGEAAMLARSVRLPGRVNPRRAPEKMLGLRDYVLGVMKEEGWITQAQYDEGVREVPKLNPHPTYDVIRGPKAARYFTDHVWAQLEREYPDEDFRGGGYRIETNLNWPLQRRATEAVAKTLAEFKGQQVNDGAIVVMDPRGRVLAEVGGPSYERRQFNVITQGDGRQPGSSFKAIVYATALRTGRYTPYSTLSNEPIHRKDGPGKTWSPQNASRNENARSYSMYTAFAASINLPAIHTVDDITPDAVVSAAHDVFGIRSPLLAVPSIALGSLEVHPIEMLEAYSVFMLGGDRAEPQTVARIIRPDGTVLRDYRNDTSTFHTGVLDAHVAQQMDDLLKGPVSRGGTAPSASIVPNARGKTGTTNDHKDAWFCGYSDGLVGVAWTGNTNFNSKRGDALSMGRRVFGGSVAVKIWTDVMLAAHDLGLANGVKSSPGTSVRVSASPEARVVAPARDPNEEAAKPQIEPVEPDPGPVEGTVDPASVEPPRSPRATTRTRRPRPPETPPGRRRSRPPLPSPPVRWFAARTRPSGASPLSRPRSPRPRTR